MLGGRLTARRWRPSLREQARSTHVLVWQGQPWQLLVIQPSACYSPASSSAACRSATLRWEAAGIAVAKQRRRRNDMQGWQGGIAGYQARSTSAATHTPCSKRLASYVLRQPCRPRPPAMRM